MKIAFLGLGTNLGDKKNNLMRAIDELSLTLGASPLALSSFLESKPWGFSSDNNFLNCVVSFPVSCTPMELLDITEQVERKLGRTAKSNDGLYSDRPIDIDILLFGDDIVEVPRLTIPHKLMHKRLFVLQPLAEIAPELIHPILKREISSLLKELTD